MNILDASWKRLLISLFLGGLISEGLRHLTENKFKIQPLLIAVVLYFVLTNRYNKSRNADQNGKGR